MCRQYNPHKDWPREQRCCDSPSGCGFKALSPEEIDSADVIELSSGFQAKDALCAGDRLAVRIVYPDGEFDVNCAFNFCRQSGCVFLGHRGIALVQELKPDLLFGKYVISLDEEQGLTQEESSKSLIPCAWSPPLACRPPLVFLLRTADEFRPRLPDGHGVALWYGLLCFWRLPHAATAS